jgi:aryl-alcohol dehydrogenase-like predicted oxidoreductase
MMNRHIEQEIMPTCAKHGIGITVFSPLAQGLLTGKYNDGVPEGSRATRSDGLRGTLTDETIVQVQRLTALAADLGLEMSQLALAWILRRPEISAVITGATRPEHVLSNVKAAGVRLTPDVLEEIETILDNAPA